MWVAFALQKLLTVFQQKFPAYLHITQCKLTNDVVSFEQLGPDCYFHIFHMLPFLFYGLFIYLV